TSRLYWRNMKGTFGQFLKINFAPPRYLSMPTAGIDISASGIKVALLAERLNGLELVAYGEELLPEGAIVAGEITDNAVVSKALKAITGKHNIHTANITLPEARSYLFEADVPGSSKEEWRTQVEQRLDEYVPLPPADVAFDVVPIVKVGDLTHLAGVGCA